tara:strand:+ start:205 stop:459 length:255 start_codon:yes stop_codon:yes gene_type:complete
MAVEDIILTPESFQTIYLRAETRVILRTEKGSKIIIRRIIPDEWVAFRLYDYEEEINNEKKEIMLFNKDYLNQIEREFKQSFNV